MGTTITTDTVVIRQGKIVLKESAEASVPEVRKADPSGLGDFSKLKPPRAVACIYCGSTEKLSDEHILPYSLGGTPKIRKGSCERCRKETHGFETAVLTGPMRYVRFIQGIQSRSRYKEMPSTIEVQIQGEGVERTIEVEIGKAPILLPYPIFREPTYLLSQDAGEVRLEGTVTGSYGVDPEVFIRGLGVTGLRLASVGSAPVAFAQMLAKIAYCFAWAHGTLSDIEAPHELVRAMMDEPNKLARYVGTLEPPYHSYEGVQHRLSTKYMEAHRVMYVEVQLFAASGAPTYVVVLGKVRSDYALATSAG